MAKQQKYYVVWVGRTSGIFNTWEECKAQVHGYEGAKYKSFDSLDQAQAAFQQGAPRNPSRAAAHALAKKNTTSSISKSSIILPSLSVDAACSGNPGIMEYRGVDTASGETIFHQGPFANGTNNIGEFLALVHALAYLKKQHSNLPIYSDSVSALAWVRNQKAKTQLQPNARNRELFDLISRAETWLQQNTYTNPILKWNTESWGEIPADFGRK